MKTQKYGMIVLIFALFLLAGCANAPQPSEDTSSTGPDAGLPNPASVYCEEQDGKSEIRTAEGGTQYGVCVFEDESECEEWSFYRGECKPGDMEEALPPVEGPAEIANPAAVFCIEQGGTSEIRTAEDGSQFGVCLFDDGSECDEWAFFRGECKAGK